MKSIKEILTNKEGFNHLVWMYRRLILLGENTEFDYMLKFKQIIDDLDEYIIEYENLMCSTPINPEINIIDAKTAKNNSEDYLKSKHIDEIKIINEQALEELKQRKIQNEINKTTEIYNNTVFAIKNHCYNYRTIEDYFVDNLEDLINYQQYSYITLVELVNKNHNSDAKYKDKNEYITKDEFLNILKDEEFVINVLEDNSYYYTIYIPEYNLKAFFFFDD